MRKFRALLPLVNAMLCAVVLLLLLADLIWPSANIFLNGFVKSLLLITCLVSAVCGGMLIARQRRRDRMWANPKPVWLVCVCHVLALGVALLLYALPHHVIPHGETAVGAVSSRGSSPQAAVQTEVQPQADSPESGAGEESPEYNAAQTVETAPAAGPIQEDEAKLQSLFGVEAVGSFRKTFADKFTSGEVEKTDRTYRSANVNVTVEERFLEELNAWAYVADIYVADISCLMTAFAQDRYGRGYTEWITDVAARYQSVVTMNGDYYGSRSAGIIIRNGELYRNNKASGDVCILYWDGHMETMRGSRCDAMNEIERGAYQSWSFGPSLLDGNGKVLSDFNCDNYLRNRHPRSAIGYFEPGHYCFVTVDGRTDESKGATLTNLATLLSKMGCKIGYNLDGGQTSLMAAGTQMVNHPSAGGRDSSDYIMIVDRITQ